VKIIRDGVDNVTEDADKEFGCAGFVGFLFGSGLPPYSCLSPNIGLLNF
jgi:hypothetical protein